MERTRDQPDPRPGVLDHGQHLRRGVGKGRIHLLVLLRQRDPDLDPEELSACGADLLWRPLGVGDAASRSHPVHRAGTDWLHGPQAVAVEDLTLEQIGDGGQADVWMRPDVQPLAPAEHRGSHLIEEDEGTDHAPPHRGERPPDREAAQVASARKDHRLDRRGGIAIRKRFVGHRPAHRNLLAHGCRRGRSVASHGTSRDESQGGRRPRRGRVCVLGVYGYTEPRAAAKDCAAHPARVRLRDRARSGHCARGARGQRRRDRAADRRALHRELRSGPAGAGGEPRCAGPWGPGDGALRQGDSLRCRGGDRCGAVRPRARRCAHRGASQPADVGESRHRRRIRSGRRRGGHPCREREQGLVVGREGREGADAEGGAGRREAPRRSGLVTQGRASGRAGDAAAQVPDAEVSRARLPRGEVLPAFAGVHRLLLRFLDPSAASRPCAGARRRRVVCARRSATPLAGCPI